MSPVWMGLVHRLSRCLPDASYSLELLALPSQTMLAAVSCSGFGPVPRVPVPEPKCRALGGSCPSGLYVSWGPQYQRSRGGIRVSQGHGDVDRDRPCGALFLPRGDLGQASQCKAQRPSHPLGPQRPLMLFKHFQRVPCEVSPAIFLQGCHTHCVAPLELLSQALWTAECSLPLEVQGQRP